MSDQQREQQTTAQTPQQEATQESPKPQGRIVELSGTAHVKLPAGFTLPTA